jgi:hypothetical protein
MSDRAIAGMIGVGNKTVSRARATVSDDTVAVRTGLDGKERRVPEVRRITARIIHTTPETRRVRIVTKESPMRAYAVAIPLPVAPVGLIGNARLDAEDMTDLVMLGVRSVLCVLPRDLRSDQRTEAIQRIAEKLLRMGVMQ